MASAFSGDPVPLDAVLIVAGTVPAVARAHLVVTERLEMFKRVRKSHGRDFSVNRCAPPLYIRGDAAALDCGRCGLVRCLVSERQIREPCRGTARHTGATAW